MPLTAKDIATLSPEHANDISISMKPLIVQKQIRNCVRVIRSAYLANPFVSGPNATRFSRTSKKKLTLSPGTFYGASSLGTAVYETMIRDRFDICVAGDRKLYPTAYRRRVAIWFSSNEPLNLIDLRNGEPTYFGVPTDVHKSSEHSHGQYFSQFIYKHLSVMGFIYPSRFTESDCIALFFDRSIRHITVSRIIRLNKPVLTSALSTMNVVVK